MNDCIQREHQWTPIVSEVALEFYPNSLAALSEPTKRSMIGYP